MSANERFFLVTDDCAFDWLNRPDLQALFTLLNRDGHEVRVVGGAVRNALLGEPVGDIDCATTAPPSLVMDWARAEDIRVLPTGLDHGTVTLLIDDTPFEVTTLRSDVETDGRHAKVAFGRDWAEDARRRDFTMNALYLDHEGRLYDPTGLGIADARIRCVRFIGDASERIAEDYLRVLRFFRFYAHYGKHFTDQDYHACIEAQSNLSSLSAERVGAEMTKLLRGAYASEALQVMHEGGMLGDILRCVPRLGRFDRLVSMSREMHLKPTVPLLLTVLCVKVEEDALRLARTLRLPNRMRDHMVRLVNGVGPIDDMSEERLQQLAYWHGKDVAQDLAMLALVYHQIAPDLTSLSMMMRNLDLWDAPRFPINGRDLIAFGIKPGPKMGEWLHDLETLWVESGFAMGKASLLARKRMRH
ncbi:CCA tRNA nucleotidyltransferase [Cohaesibacter sp. CAU 1516]|uniref:CCA tRNA nucleotidyltransferase n=1 Tax=Cohaesibacter sp. CAU 1516 TaxID=2576038 RepID=UPI0010FE4BB1|nr:CCA tRNA nucleotidyltransferase [Cohaesibacter sp. CAU 1516]TLP48300.1 CCA tRNA nucleotidyltransferase [Cohaesibacter sp. CAU 1516]